MKTSNKGMEFIKKWEGCRLKAYKCFSSEKYYTIGYGHYGKDVRSDMTITQAQADEYLKEDIKWCEEAVNKLRIVTSKMQDAFDALVSFTYNCGEGNLKKLTDGRSLDVISEKILLYNKSGGVVVNGLTKRRIEESALIKGCLSKGNESAQLYYPKPSYTGSSIVDALKSIGVSGSFEFRKKIANANGITGYSGKASENMSMLNMLKNGILRRV